MENQKTFEGSTYDLNENEELIIKENVKVKTEQINIPQTLKDIEFKISVQNNKLETIESKQDDIFGILCFILIINCIYIFAKIIKLIIKLANKK